MTDNEKLLKLRKMADAMYYAAQYLTTDASRLHMAMDEYHQFIIHEYHKEEPTIAEIVDEHFDEMLGEEPVSEDLDSFAIKYAQDKPYPVTVCQSVKAGAKWQKQKDNNDANHALVEQIKTQQMCYEKGMADMKQQMMKDALDSTIVDDGLYKSIVPTMQAMLRYNKGDKVKIIIIKEE